MRISIPLLAGLSWSAIYILLESAQSVFFGAVLQQMDSFQLGFWVFGITSFFLFLGIRRFDPEQIRLCGRNLQGLFACNCSTAAGWILYLFSIQLIEPAVAFTLSSAAMPVSAIGLAFLRIGEPVTLDTRQKRIGFVLVSAGIVFLVGTTLLGFSGFVRGSLVTGLLGSASALLSGCAFAWMLIHCRALDAKGLCPVPVFAFRFPLYIVLAAFGWLLGLDYKAPVETGDAAIAILIGLAIMAFPLYAMQKALSGISVLLLSTITALGPFIVFLMQMVEGRVAFSGFTLAGLLIYSSGVLLAMPGLIQEGVREAPRPDTVQTLTGGKP
ncbi:MAG: DMT family transporter [Gammaproteobacteria bacterium]|nr:DMT family transporter [Boseongicola sp. SB0665_bin_10]MYG66650.1 DMT family transporter [Gammaproteobacteria bacterium]